jgi:hypothetical protein
LQTTVSAGRNYVQWANPSGDMGYIGYGGADGKFYIYNQLNDDMLFYTNSSLRLTIAGSTGAATFSNLSGSGNRIVIANSSGTLISAVIGSGLAFDGTTLTATGGSSGSISGSGSSGTIALFTGSTSIGNSVITQSSSNIGIGPNTPNYKLNVFDTGVVISSGQANFSTNTRGIMIDNTNNGDESVGVWFRTGTNHLSGISGQRNNSASTWGTDLRFYTHPNDFVNLTTATERMRITSEGNVMIGTTSDNGERLQVNGRSFFNGDLFTVDNGGIFFSGFNSFAIGILKNASGLVLQTGGSPRLTITPLGGASFTGNVSAPGFFESSDATIKTLIQDDYQAKGIDSVVAKLYIKNGKKELGYFAQDLKNVLPNAVNKGSDGLLNLSYREVHTAKIAYLEEQIKQIKKRYEIN